MREPSLESGLQQQQILRRYCLLLGLVWAVVVSFSFISHYTKHKHCAEKTGYDIAVANLNKDQSIRQWLTVHGGVYVPPAEKTPPNPHLAHIPDRDIVTDKNRKLTLMNPAYMIRQFNEMFGENYGIQGHITSLKPLRPENAPDLWEHQALLSFEKGAVEARALTMVEGQSYARLMRPIITLAGCLKCHEGYQVGDIRGGVGVLVPLAGLYAIAESINRTTILWHGLILLLGFAGIGFAFVKLSRQIAAHDEPVKRAAKERELFITLMNSIDALVYVIDMKSDEMLFLNRGGEKMFGGAGLGKPCWQVLQKGMSGPCSFCPREQLLDDHGEPQKEPYVWEFQSTINQRWYQSRDQAILWPDGRLVSLGMATDITEQKEQQQHKLEAARIQEELKRYDSLKTMAGAIAHKFNNSMTSVIGNLELAEMTLMAGSGEQKMIANALRSALGASRTGSLMLTYVGQKICKFRRENLADLARESITELKHIFPSSIALKFIAPPEPLGCDLDHEQIKEVLDTVITNAIESMDGNIGTLEISFGRQFYHADSFPLPFQTLDLAEPLEDGEYSFCQIRDSGHGVSETDLKRVFEPFFTSKFVGRGLGLALTVGIMRTHYGALTIDSEDGTGTTVRILLPAIKILNDKKQV